MECCMESLLGLGIFVWFLFWIFGDSYVERSTKEVKNACVELSSSTYKPLFPVINELQADEARKQIYKLYSSSPGMSWETAALRLELSNFGVSEAIREYESKLSEFSFWTKKYEEDSLLEEDYELNKNILIGEITKICEGYNLDNKNIQKVDGYPLIDDGYKNRPLLCTTYKTEGCITTEESADKDVPVTPRLSGKESLLKLSQVTSIDAVLRAIELDNQYGFMMFPAKGYSDGLTGFLLTNEAHINPLYSFVDCGKNLVYRSKKWIPGCRYSFKLATVGPDGSLVDRGIRAEYSIAVGETKFGSNNSSWAEGIINGNGLAELSLQ